MGEVPRDVCLKRRRKQTLIEMVEARKRAEQKSVLSLLGYDLSARRKRSADGTGLGSELQNLKNETRVKLEGDAEDSVLSP